MSSQPARHPLAPGEIVAALESLRRRVTLLGLARGLGLLALVACGLVVAGAALDYLLRLPGVPRLVLLAGAAGLLAWLAYRHVVRPVRRAPGIGDVAGRVEEHFPQFGDRLRSGLTFLRDPAGVDRDPLRRRAVEEAGEVAGTVRLADVFDNRPALTYAVGGVAAITIVAALALLLGPLAGTIAGRLFDPMNEAHQWPKRYAVAPLSLPAVIPAGRPLEVTATLNKGDANRAAPVVYYQIGDGPVRQQLMSLGDNGRTFAAAVDPRLAEASDRGALRVWVEAGDDTTAFRTVAVVRRPALASAVAEISPPAYVPADSPAAAPRVIDLTAEPATVGVGSRVRLALSYTKPLADDGTALSLRPLGESVAPQIEFTSTGPGTASAEFAAIETVRFEATATGVDGFEADSSPPFEILVRPDQRPTVRLAEPRGNESRTAEAVVPVEIAVEDDFGFEYAEFVVEKLVPNGPGGLDRRRPPARRRRGLGRHPTRRRGRGRAVSGAVRLGSRRPCPAAAGGGRRAGDLRAGQGQLRPRRRVSRAARERPAARDNHQPARAEPTGHPRVAGGQDASRPHDVAAGGDAARDGRVGGARRGQGRARRRRPRGGRAVVAPAVGRGGAGEAAVAEGRRGRADARREQLARRRLEGAGRRRVPRPERGGRGRDERGGGRPRRVARN